MLKLEELINKIGEQYRPMLSQINIVDFYKCIAQFSGLKLDSISDDAIVDYLTKWCVNKHRFFKLLGNSIRTDKKISYEENLTSDSFMEKVREIEIDFPAYAPWLEISFDRWNRKNQFPEMCNLNWESRDLINRLFPSDNLSKMNITRVFQNKLGAPVELVNKISSLFDIQKVNDTYTLSIDPVDMMLASETSYDWDSCYRLENTDSSHADGCLAAVCDSSSLIAYTWTKEEKFKMDYRTSYEFKKIRHKKTRQWISINPENTAIHFNQIYPKKDGYSDEFIKLYRTIAETIVCDYTGKENLWVKYTDVHGYGCRKCDREIYYGYDEFDSSYVYCLKEVAEDLSFWSAYDEHLVCPCGCGGILTGSSEEENCDGAEAVYNGDGFICENINYRYYCEHCDDYCDCECCRENCLGCSWWDDAHPVCEFDMGEECDYLYEREVDVYDGVAHCNGECSECWICRRRKEEEEEDDD